MPKHEEEKLKRKAVRLPEPLVNIIDEIVVKSKIWGNNRQQFVEWAVREKILQVQQFEAKQATANE